MQRTYFALPDEATPRIGVFWEMIGGGWGVTFDKKQIGNPGTRAALEAGDERALPDGSILRLQAILRPVETVVSPLPAPDEAPNAPIARTQILAWRDGVPLREARDYSARDNIRQASLIAWLVGASDLVLGLTVLSQVGFSRALFTGTVFVLAGFGLRSEKSWAASLGLGIAVADLIITMPLALRSGFSTPLFLLVLSRVLLIVSLHRAVNSLRELQAPIVPNVITTHE